jgi:hypothetical protein
MDCTKSFGIGPIPQFHFYANGTEYTKFTGANQDKLLTVLTDLNEQVSSKFINHKNLDYKQFRPMNLAPQGFTSLAMVDKMKEFIVKFSQSEEVKKEVKDVSNITKWLAAFKIENMPKEAIDELIQMAEVAEDKSKIALIDLCRLLMMQ